jgi:hypothetical protein
MASSQPPPLDRAGIILVTYPPRDGEPIRVDQIHAADDLPDHVRRALVDAIQRGRAKRRDDPEDGRPTWTVRMRLRRLRYDVMLY